MKIRDWDPGQKGERSLSSCIVHIRERAASEMALNLDSNSRYDSRMKRESVVCRALIFSIFLSLSSELGTSLSCQKDRPTTFKM